MIVAVETVIRVSTARMVHGSRVVVISCGVVVVWLWSGDGLVMVWRWTPCGLPPSIANPRKRRDGDAHRLTAFAEDGPVAGRVRLAQLCPRVRRPLGAGPAHRRTEPQRHRAGIVTVGNSSEAWRHVCEEEREFEAGGA